MTTLKLPAHLVGHKAFNRVFQQGKLTFGLIAPFKGYPDGPIPDMDDHLELAQMADKGGISALWLRDVPFYDPNFGDAGQQYDTMVDLGYLAAATKNIALGTAGIVSPLRNPVLTAKQAASVDRLSGGRLLLGMSSGDRPVEYPAFGYDFDNRAERFRESWDIIRLLTENSYPKRETKHYGTFSGNIDMVPKLVSPRLPMLTIGRARQDMSWIANHSDAWIWHGVDPRNSANIIRELQEAGDGETWRPFGYANFLELSENPNEPLRMFNNIFMRAGTNTLMEFWKQQEAAGVSHITLNLKPSRRPGKEVLQELIENVLPHFSAIPTE
ncbi:MAG: LLM class oxidoreductase [Pantoea agglomerans]